MLRLRRQFRMSQKPKHTQPVIKADKYDALLSDIRAIILILRSRPAHVSAAVNEHHYRQFFVGSLRGCPDIQIQTVFTDGDQPFMPGAAALGFGGRLHARGGEMVRCPDSLPGDNRLRRTPAEIAYGRRSVGYTAKQPHTGTPLDRGSPGDLSTLDTDRLRYAGPDQPGCGKHTE